MKYISLVTCIIFFFAAAQLLSAAAEYKLAPDDVIEINVWGEPDLSRKQIQVNSEGNITVPYVNHIIHEEGKTQQELAAELRNEYITQEILVDPKIDVNVVVRHKLTVSVLGEVQRPGVITYKEGDTLMSALADAGSYTENARLEAATLTRKDSKKPIPIDLKKLYHDGDLSQNVTLQEGDIIYLPEDTYNRYYVLGEVMRPGLYFLRDNTSVLSAVSQAGGITERGSMKNVMLVRGDSNNPEKRTVDLGKMMKGDLSQDVTLEPGDVVYVAETSKPDWNKISSILNAITSIGVIRRYGIF